MRQNIFTISGKQGSGKSELAKRLERKFIIKLSTTPITLKFADPLYEMQDAIHEILDDYEIRRPKKDGFLLQWLGTQYGRDHIDQDIWVNIMKTRLADLNKGIPVMIDDCRFENEFEILKEMNCLMIRLECPEYIRKQRTNSWRTDTQHASEIGLDRYSMKNKFDLYIDTGTWNAEYTLDLAWKSIERILDGKNSNETKIKP